MFHPRNAADALVRAEFDPEAKVHLHIDEVNEDLDRLRRVWQAEAHEEADSLRHIVAQQEARIQELEVSCDTLTVQLKRLDEALDESMHLHQEACAQDGEWPQELSYAAEVWTHKDSFTYLARQNTEEDT